MHQKRSQCLNFQNFLGEHAPVPPSPRHIPVLSVCHKKILAPPLLLPLLRPCSSPVYSRSIIILIREHIYHIPISRSSILISGEIPRPSRSIFNKGRDISSDAELSSILIWGELSHAQQQQHGYWGRVYNSPLAAIDHH